MDDYNAAMANPGTEYERGFIDGAQHQMKSSVDKAVNALSKPKVMNNEYQRVWEALRLIYGRDLQAGTVTVLVKDGETAVRFITSTLPQDAEK